jgi:hypothetical protein
MTERMNKPDSSNRLPVLAEEIKRAHSGVQDAAKTAADRAIEAGRALLEAKALVKHGQWLPWLKEHCGLPERTAQLYMHIAKLGLESATVADLGLKAAAKAIVLQYPYPDPFEEGSEDERREWMVFALLVMTRVHMLPDSVQLHCDWLKRKGFSPSGWMGDEGDGCRMKPVSEELKAAFRVMLDKHATTPLADLTTEMQEEAQRIAAYVREHPESVISSGDAKPSRRWRAA